MAQLNEEDNFPNSYNNSSKGSSPFWIILTIFVILGGLSLCACMYYEHRKKVQRKDFMWIARGELELMKGVKSVSFLKLQNVSFSNDTLNVVFQSGFSTNPILKGKKEDKTLTTSLDMSHALLMAYSCVFPESWDTICKYLDKANANLHIKYQNNNTSKDVDVTITPEELKSLFSEKNKEIGLKLFSTLKAMETVVYAKRHYYNDPIFKVDSVALEDSYVTLHISYDDSKFDIIHFTEDSIHVNAHFTDDVGEMGSILDNMLEICVRTGRGFAFVYTGRKLHRVNRLQWDYSKIDDYVDAKVIRGLRNDERHFNTVHTVVFKKI